MKTDSFAMIMARNNGTPWDIELCEKADKIIAEQAKTIEGLGIELFERGKEVERLRTLLGRNTRKES